MKISIVDTYEDMCTMAVLILQKQLEQKPASVFGFASGGTMLGLYEKLVKAYEKKELDFSRASAFSLDEYCGLSKENPHSYAYYMEQNFYQYVNFKRNNIYIPDGMEKDIGKECRNYDEQIKKCGGIDLQIVGLGVNGHIGFNEPGVSFDQETHLVTLTQSTIAANSRFFLLKNEVPTTAITMGIKTILQSKKLILLVNREDKAEAVYQTVNGKVSNEIPASVIQRHQNATLLIEKNAAKRLEKFV